LNIRRSARLDLTLSTAISYANCQARFATYARINYIWLKSYVVNPSLTISYAYCWDLQVICSKSYASRMLPQASNNQKTKSKPRIIRRLSLLIILGKARLQEDWHSQSQPGNKHKTLSYAYCLGLCQSYASDNSRQG
jgi:hypothetical protein